MKKTIVMVLLLALLCLALCACTEKNPEGGQSEPKISNPELQTQEGQNQETAGTSENTAHTQDQDAKTGDKESREAQGNTELSDPDESADPLEPPAPPVSEYDDDPDMETVTDLVIDGGDGFGIGGN